PDELISQPPGEAGAVCGPPRDLERAKRGDKRFGAKQVQRTGPARALDERDRGLEFCNGRPAKRKRVDRVQLRRVFGRSGEKSRCGYTAALERDHQSRKRLVASQRRGYVLRLRGLLSTEDPLRE